MTGEELFYAQDLFDTISSNKKQLELLKKDLATFKREISYPIMTFEMSDMLIKVYRDDVVKCMEGMIGELEVKIREQQKKFSEL